MGVAKVLAFTCSGLTVVLMIAATSTSDWMISSGWREGLFSQCIGSSGMLPVPFAESRDIQSRPGCYKGRGTGYLLGVTALVIIGLTADFLATLFLGIDVCKNAKKYKKLSVIGLSIAGVAFLLALIIYGVYFSKDLHTEPKLTGYKWDEDRIVNDMDFDNDGISDDVDLDDDNDGIADDKENLDWGYLGDLDGDGIPDEEDTDIDGDGQLNEEDPDDDNDGVMDVDDGDDDNDGVADTEEDDDDENADALTTEGVDDGEYEGEGEPGEEDAEEKKGTRRVISYGYGFGATCSSIVLIFVSVGLIIIDKESKQVDGHENQIEQGGNA